MNPTLVFTLVLLVGYVSSQDIRLVGGEGDFEGRVEVLNPESGLWGTVCDDGFGMEEAKVICRQLGYGRALASYMIAHFGQGTGSINLDDLSCVGDEASLADCRHPGWGRHNCGHREDAGVTCTNDAADAAEVDGIRLVGGEDRYEGRVEVVNPLTNEWGTVCDDIFGLEEAKVICRQLGFARALAAHSQARFGMGTGSVVLDDLSCVGDEAVLGDCVHAGWGISNCHHGEDASVTCSDDEEDPNAGGDPNAHEMDLRLAASGPISEGYIEVYHEGHWGTVCDMYFTQESADVACRQLGYTGRSEAVIGGLFGLSTSPSLLYELMCNGGENHINDCHTYFAYEMCSAENPAGVRCGLEDTAAAPDCNPGSSSSTGQAPCDPCGYSRYSLQEGATDCDFCPAGTFTRDMGSSSTEQCLQMVGQLMYEGPLRHEARVTNTVIITNTTQTVTLPAGRIIQWVVNTQAAGSVTLGIFRRGSNERRFIYVGGSTFGFNGAGERTIDIEPEEQFDVEEGDLLGIIAGDSQPVSMQFADCEDGVSTTMKRRITEIPEVGSETVIRPGRNRIVCRKYLFSAIISLRDGN